MNRLAYFSKTISVITLLIAVTACSQRNADSSATSELAMSTESLDTDRTPQELPLPEVPALITVPEARADYVAARFWQALDFTDKSLSLDTAFMEQNFANFTSVMAMATERGRRTAMDKLVARAATDADALAYLAEVAEKYLYDPNSPLRDDDCYIAFAEALDASAAVDTWIKARPGQLAGRLRKNRPGTRAADFAFTTPGGRRMMLSDLSHGIDDNVAVMLIFFDPDCPNCNETLRLIAASGRIAEAISAGALRILAVYPPEDSVVADSWADYAAKLPVAWTTGIIADPESFDDNYALPALPSIYLLSGNLTVVGRDLTLSSPQLQSII